jgi:hypothetical protein
MNCLSISDRAQVVSALVEGALPSMWDYIVRGLLDEWLPNRHTS